MPSCCSSLRFLKSTRSARLVLVPRLAGSAHAAASGTIIPSSCKAELVDTPCWILNWPHRFLSKMPGLAVKDFSHGYQNCLQANKTIIITRTNRIPFETKGCQETDLQRGNQVSVHSSPTRWKRVFKSQSTICSASVLLAEGHQTGFALSSLPEAVRTRPRGY